MNNKNLEVIIYGVIELSNNDTLACYQLFGIQATMVLFICPLY